MTAGGSAPPLILASGSPRRAAILETLGLAHRVDPVDVREEPRPDEAPAEYAERLAREKAAASRPHYPGALILAGDTVVVAGARILEKPADREAAVEMLLALSGRTHRVASALALARPEGPVLAGVRWTEVRFRPFAAADARAYADTGEPLDKAGGYGIQGMGSALVESVRGDYSGVVGLPVSLLVELLSEAGWPYAFGRLREAG